MNDDVRIGGVTARFNPDGTLYIYQPDSSRLMGPELARQLVEWLQLRTADEAPALKAAFEQPRQFERDHEADMQDPEYAQAYEAEALIHTRGPLEGQPIESEPVQSTPRRRGRPPTVKRNRA